MNGQSTSKMREKGQGEGIVLKVEDHGFLVQGWAQGPEGTLKSQPNVVRMCILWGRRSVTFIRFSKSMNQKTFRSSGLKFQRFPDSAFPLPGYSEVVKCYGVSQSLQV